LKAVRISRPGGPEAMSYEEVAAPEPGAGEVRVRLEATGVNFIDVYQRTGQYPVELPHTLGLEGAGVVDAVGEDVEGVEEGERVAWAMSPGAYAEQAVVPAWKLAPVPEGVDPKVAAAVMLQGMTAHYLTHSTFPVESGQTVLVHAAAGGVGLLLVQLAKRRGATVIGTVSTEQKARLAKEAGADEIIRYTEQDFVAATRRITGGAGVHAVYDSVGRSTFEGGLDLLRPRGYMVLFGQSSGPVRPLDPQVLNAKGSLFLTRPSLAHYALDREEISWRAGDLFRWIEAGELDVRIDREVPLAQTAAAHRALEARETSGKVVLVP
jgi:NADPH2:quinone reductase